MDIHDIALGINEKAHSYAFGKLQELRRELTGHETHTHKIFSESTIFSEESYAYHDGGRKELQFNIGFESNDCLRYGVAFSLEPSQSLPDPSVLYPKIDRFNYYVRAWPEALSGMKMWCYSTSGRQDFTSPVQIDNTMSQLHSFIFIGKTVSTKSIDYNEILSSMDQLMPLYEYVERGEDHSSVKKMSGEFVAGSKKRLKSTSASIPGGIVDVALRHNELQAALYQMLACKHGPECVREEHPLEYGGKVDVVAKSEKGLTFYEIKVAPSAKSAVREALGQVIEYSYWPEAQRAMTLIVVAEPAATSNTKRYLSHLRKIFGVDIYYCCINMAQNRLSQLF